MQARAVPRFAAAKAGYEHSLLLDSTGSDAPIVVDCCHFGTTALAFAAPPEKNVGKLHMV
jgi:hypothetical protein